MPGDPEHRSLIALDIERYGWGGRVDPARVRLRGSLRTLCLAMLEQAGAVQGDYATSDTGDGLLISVSAEVSKLRLLDPLVPDLAAYLREHNAGRPPAEQMRLRFAIHAGEVLRDPDPMHGEATIFTCRLLDADVLRSVLRCTAAPLALIVSEVIYHSIVKHQYGRIDPAAYHPVQVEAKEVSARAWVHVPGDPEAPRRARVRAAGGIVRPDSQPPRELLADTQVFVGRQRELGRLRKLLGRVTTRRGTTVVAIDGVGGVGKSALALRAAHQLADRYPDGQLYVDLQGATPELAPLNARVALGRLLHSLGVPDAEVPRDVHDAAARYRSLLADRRVLIVLDNARDTDQVRPLLPGGRGCAVVVTSRTVLPGLDVRARFPLGVLRPAEAVALLGSLAGDERLASEPEAADVARACGYLPLALKIAGARMAGRPAGTVGAMARRLADEHRRLDELRLRDLSVRTSLEVTYRSLEGLNEQGASLTRAFRLLSLPDSPDVAATTAAALLDVPPPSAEAVLERLVDEHLLESPSPGRYRFHDLVRLLARERALRDEPAAARAAALRRATGFYLATARNADQLVRTGQSTALGWRRQASGGLGFADRAAALAWLEDEHANLAAAVVQAATAVAAGGDDALPLLGVQLANTLLRFFHLRSYAVDGEAAGDWGQVAQLVAETARRMRDRRGEAQALNVLGIIAWRRYRLGDADGFYRRSLELHRGAGDREGECDTLNNLGILYRAQRRYADAVECYTRCLRLREELGDLLGEGQTLNNLGVVHRELGALDEAMRCYQQSLAVCQKLGDRHGEGNALHSLGEALLAQGRHREAVDCFLEDLTICRELGDLHGEGMTLDSLGETRLAQGRLEDAVAYYHESLRLHRAAGDRESECHEEARTLMHLGVALRALGRPADAEDRLRQALRTLERQDAPEAAEVRRRLQG